MLFLRKIVITQFKNYSLQTFDFHKKVTGIAGLNGIGKTNLLDAIYYCCFTKSYFSGPDQLNIKFNEDGFRIESHFNLSDILQKVVCINRKETKKEFYLNDVLYEKLSQHIGLLPAVMIAPDDINIINGGSEGRRKYLDTILCQIDKDYLKQLIVYNKILLQRNSLLKLLSSKQSNDLSLLDILDQQLASPCKLIYEKRKAFAENNLSLIADFYNKISGSKEAITVSYDSALSEHEFETLLKMNRPKDILLQRTQSGIHRDDLSFKLNNEVFKAIASQGQKKSLLFALKLSEYETIKLMKGFAPLLLLDDVFEKLDEQRMDNLLRWVCVDNNGQVFITDTHQERLSMAFERLQIDGDVIALTS